MTRQQAYHKRNPLKRKFWLKKSNAKRRGIQFAITYDQFLEVYQRGKVIDRIDATKGYIEGNIQPLTPKQNAKKGATTDKIAHRNKYQFRIWFPVSDYRDTEKINPPKALYGFDR